MGTTTNTRNRSEPHPARAKNHKKRPSRATQRRETIVATAWQLIAERGYEATSLNTLIAKLGISKGSLYHHFQSKAAVVDAVVEMLTLEATQRVSADNEGAKALDRLCAFIRAGWEWHEDHQNVSTEITLVMLRPENSELLARITATERRVVRPLLESIINQGMKEGSFKVPDAALATDLLMPLLSDALIRIAGQITQGQLDAAGFVAQLEFLQYALEQILGAPKGSLRGAIPDSALSVAEVSAFIEYLNTNASNGAPHKHEKT